MWLDRSVLCNPVRYRRSPHEMDFDNWITATSVKTLSDQLSPVAYANGTLDQNITTFPDTRSESCFVDVTNDSLFSMPFVGHTWHGQVYVIWGPS
jgi:hypothetical protein